MLGLDTGYLMWKVNVMSAKEVAEYLRVKVVVPPRLVFAIRFFLSGGAFRAGRSKLRSMYVYAGMRNEKRGARSSGDGRCG